MHVITYLVEGLHGQLGEPRLEVDPAYVLTTMSTRLSSRRTPTTTPWELSSPEKPGVMDVWGR